MIALLHPADDPPPAVSSGDSAQGCPLKRLHVACLALSDVEGPLGRLGAWKVGADRSGRPAVKPASRDLDGTSGGRHALVHGDTGRVGPPSEGEGIGLPAPQQVILTPVSAHLGTPPSHASPRLRRKDGSDRRHVHAIVVFAEPVRGPVLVGAGRYRGYGVLRPMGGDCTYTGADRIAQ